MSWNVEKNMIDRVFACVHSLKKQVLLSHFSIGTHKTTQLALRERKNEKSAFQ